MTSEGLLLKLQAAELELGELRTRLSEQDREIGQLRFKVSNLAGEAVENERMRAALALVATDVEGVWRWQGDGRDDPQSLSCPVVMSADKLREIVGEPGRSSDAAGLREMLREIVGESCDHSPPVDDGITFGQLRTCRCGQVTYEFRWGGPSTRRPRAVEVRSMRSARLNARVREAVLERLMQHAFKEPKEEISRLSEELASEVYDDVYPPSVRRKMRGLPEGFLDTAASLRVCFGGQVADLRVSPRPVADCHARSTAAARSYPADHRFALEWGKIDAKYQLLTAQMSVARRQAKALLESCSTCRQLVDSWPEVEPFVRDFTEATTPQVVALAVPVRELNCQFNLGEGEGGSTFREIQKE